MPDEDRDSSSEIAALRAELAATRRELDAMRRSRDEFRDAVPALEAKLATRDAERELNRLRGQAVLDGRNQRLLTH